MSSRPQQTSGRKAGELPRVTVLSRSFPPAYLVGGPARSVAALVEALGMEYCLSVITSAYDGPTQARMMGVQPDQWSGVSGAHIWYSSQRRPSVRQMKVLLRDTRPELIYLNSLFDFRFSLMPLAIVRFSHRRVPVLLAPRGELSVGALALKQRKKRFFLACWRSLRLHSFVEWHASNELEMQDIRRALGDRPFVVHEAMNLHTAIDLKPRVENTDFAERHISGERNERVPAVVFLSRIVPKKNLVGLLRALPGVTSQFTLTIAGPPEDPRYWTKCAHVIEGLAPDKRPTYLGPVSAADVVSFLTGFDLFVLPTFGENFGHVVLEALEAGIPVIVGKDTPWQVIEDRGAGWLCDPNDQQQLTALLQRFLDLGDDERQRMSAAASLIAADFLADPARVQANRTMFTTMLSQD